MSLCVILAVTSVMSIEIECIKLSSNIFTAKTEGHVVNATLAIPPEYH